MNNQEIVDAFYTLDSLKYDVNYIQSEIDFYTEKLQNTKKQIELASQVKEIYNNVPLTIEEVKGFINDFTEVRPIINPDRKANIIQQGSKYRVVLINHKDIVRLGEFELLIAKDLAFNYCSTMLSPAEFKYDYERGFLK